MRHEQLAVIRGFGTAAEGVVMADLFCLTNRNKGYVVGDGDHELHWQYPVVFTSGSEVESLDCKQARRMAVGLEAIEFCEAPAITFPGRFLVSDKPNRELVTRQNVHVRWKLDGLIELPKFCASHIGTETRNVIHRTGLRRVRDDVLKAAVALKPRKWDLYGFVTSDKLLAGALEIVSARDDSLYEVSMLATNDERRELHRGDQLFARFRTSVRNTSIVAEALIAEVVDVGVPQS